MQEPTIEKFIDNWQEDALGLKPVFVSYFKDLQKMVDADIEFNERPGISYSLRGMNKWILPIIQNDEINGFVNICGRPYCNADRIYTEYISKTVEVDATTIEKLLPCLKPIDPRTLKEMKRYIKGYLQ